MSGHRVLAMLPVELACRTIGPISVGSDTLYQADGKDWKRAWWLHVSHVGAVSVHLPAWLLNALCKHGLIRDIRLTDEDVDRLRAENAAICDMMKKQNA